MAVQKVSSLPVHSNAWVCSFIFPKGNFGISAAVLGGYIECRLHPRNEEEQRKADELGMDTQKIYTLDEICKGNQVFFAGTGVSDGDLLRGVRLYSGGATTNSLVMRAESGTVRYIETYHHWAKPSITNIHRHGPHGTIQDD